MEEDNVQKPRVRACTQDPTRSGIRITIWDSLRRFALEGVQPAMNDRVTALVSQGNMCKVL